MKRKVTKHLFKKKSLGLKLYLFIITTNIFNPFINKKIKVIFDVTSKLKSAIKHRD